jgi:hypothetical protein
VVLIAVWPFQILELGSIQYVGVLSATFGMRITSAYSTTLHRLNVGLSTVLFEQCGLYLLLTTLNSDATSHKAAIIWSTPIIIEASHLVTLILLSCIPRSSILFRRWLWLPLMRDTIPSRLNTNSNWNRPSSIYCFGFSSTLKTALWSFHFFSFTWYKQTLRFLNYKALISLPFLNVLTLITCWGHWLWFPRRRTLSNDRIYQTRFFGVASSWLRPPGRPCAIPARINQLHFPLRFFQSFDSRQQRAHATLWHQFSLFLRYQTPKHYQLGRLLLTLDQPIDSRPEARLWCHSAVNSAGKNTWRGSSLYYFAPVESQPLLRIILTVPAKWLTNGDTFARLALLGWNWCLGALCCCCALYSRLHYVWFYFERPENTWRTRVFRGL